MTFESHQSYKIVCFNFSDEPANISFQGYMMEKVKVHDEPSSRNWTELNQNLSQCIFQMTLDIFIINL